jgi:hypothetical protein
LQATDQKGFFSYGTALVRSGTQAWKAYHQARRAACQPAYLPLEGTGRGLITDTQEPYFTIELDALIVDVQSRQPNCQAPGRAPFTHLEDVYFTHGKILWTHASGSADWRSAGRSTRLASHPSGLALLLPHR